MIYNEYKYDFFAAKTSPTETVIQDIRTVNDLAKPIYNKNISPCCGYCANAQLSPSLKLVFCKYKGPVSELDVCRKYAYDPLKRVPKSSVELPSFDREDFTL